MKRNNLMRLTDRTEERAIPTAADLAITYLPMQDHGTSNHSPDELLERFVSWAYVCSTFNANRVASQPYKLYVKGNTSNFPTRALPLRGQIHLRDIGMSQVEDVREILSHPVLDLLASANDVHTGREFMELSWLNMELLGNCYWLLRYNSFGVPSAIYPLMAHRVKIVTDTQGQQIIGYEYTAGQTIERYTPEEIIQIRFSHPTDPLYGKSPLEAALPAVDKALSIHTYENALFRNGAAPGVLITAPKVSEEARKRLEKVFNKKHQGARNAGKTAVIESKEMTLQQFGFSPKDSMVIEAHSFARDEIAHIYKIPLTVLGIISAARAEAEEQARNYALNGLGPRLAILESTINEKLIPLFDASGRLFLKFDNPVPEDRLAEAEIQAAETDILAKRVAAGIMTVDEAREAIGFGPLPAQSQQGE